MLSDCDSGTGSPSLRGFFGIKEEKLRERECRKLERIFIFITIGMNHNAFFVLNNLLIESERTLGGKGTMV